MPMHRYVTCGQNLTLQTLERRADFHEMQHNGLAKLRHDLCRAQGIENHAAAARAQLDEAHLPGRSHRLPGRGGPQSKQLAKHLADFGSRYEVALPADGHMAGIVTV